MPAPHAAPSLLSRGSEHRSLLSFLNRRFRRGFTLRVCRSLIASSMSVTRRLARTKRRRSCMQLGRLHCCSGFGLARLPVQRSASLPNKPRTLQDSPSGQMLGCRYALLPPAGARAACADVGAADAHGSTQRRRNYCRLRRHGVLPPPRCGVAQQQYHHQVC